MKKNSSLLNVSRRHFLRNTAVLTAGGIGLQHVIFYSSVEMERVNEIKSEIYSFRTLDPGGDTATFACWNDTHVNQTTITRLTEMLKQQAPGFMIWNGDVTNITGTADKNKLIVTMTDLDGNVLEELQYEPLT